MLLCRAAPLSHIPSYHTLIGAAEEQEVPHSPTPRPPISILAHTCVPPSNHTASTLALCANLRITPVSPGQASRYSFAIAGK